MADGAQLVGRIETLKQPTDTDERSQIPDPSRQSASFPVFD
jgi:hypothetical protein